MNRSIVFYPECHVDTLLAEVVGWKYGLQRNKQIYHVFGTQLFKTLKENENAEIAVGFFDKNRKLHEIRDFAEYRKIGAGTNEVSFLQHSIQKTKYLFYVEKGIEEWVLEAATAVDIVPEDYNLPSDLEAFRKEAKSEILGSKPNMRRFLKALVRAQPPQIQTLERYIRNIFGLDEQEENNMMQM